MIRKICFIFSFLFLCAFLLCGCATSTYVGEDYLEFNIIDVDTMEYRETVMINSQLVLEVVFGGADISRIVAEISSMLPES